MRAFLIVCFILLSALPVKAGDSLTNEAGSVRLISATQGLGDGAVRLGVDFTLHPGWKIYWRSPGDAGLAPKLDWAESANLADPVLSWPAPKRFELAGLQNHGYADRVILPVSAHAVDPARPVRVAVKLEYLACAQICVPMQGVLSLTLPPGPAQASAEAQAIARFQSLVPGDGARHGLTLLAVESLGTGDQSRLRVTVHAQSPLNKPDVFVEPGEIASFGAPQVDLSADRQTAYMTVAVAPGSLAQPLDSQTLTLTVTDGLASLEARQIPQPGQAPSSPLLAMLGLALLGGLILNLMPCVLPVLSIKVLGVLNAAGTVRARAAFAAGALGILVSFLLLALAAIGLKLAGQAVGWGIQFQQPWFLALMMALILGFAANLWGWFEIRLPFGLSGSAGHGLTGHFLSGMLATLLATPCSAPFLGTALGFALSQGPVEILAIFTALGLGMAAPFLILALWPGLAARLPRPGAWMVMVKKGLALILLATALWLGTVLAAVLGWGAPPQARTGTVAWVPFDAARIQEDIRAGRLVFVDVTADWCITCKVNKANVVEQGPVAQRLAGDNVVAMKADWTRPDAAIAAYLAGFGRYGIPFNVVYGPKAPQGIALPELLTDSVVLDALERAR